MGGTPIQKSPDQSLLSGSPKLIAASHVLHRFQLPRCPPFALTALTRHTLYSLVKEQRSLFAAQILMLTQPPKPVKAIDGDNAGDFTRAPTRCQGIFRKSLHP
jgi:hypothetical protein